MSNDNIVNIDGTPYVAPQNTAMVPVEPPRPPKAEWPTLPIMAALGGLNIDKLVIIAEDTQGTVRTFRSGVNALETIGILEVSKAQVLMGAA